MSKFLKAFAALLCILAVHSAFAQDGVMMYNPSTRSWVPPGVPLVNGSQQNVPIYQNGILQGYAPAGYNQQVIPQYVPAYGQQVMQQVVPQMMSGNSLINNCSVIGGVIGGGAANVATHHDKWSTVAGALLGGAVGNLVCNNSQGQRVIVQQPQQVQYQQPQTVYVQAPQTAAVNAGYQQVSAPQTVQVRVPVVCDFGGGVTVKVDEASMCARVAERMTQRVESRTFTQETQSVQTSQARVQQQTSVSPASACSIKNDQTGETKSIANPLGNPSYCTQLAETLGAGILKWENL